MKQLKIFIIVFVAMFVVFLGIVFISGFLSTVNPEAMMEKAVSKLETLDLENNPARLDAELKDVSGGESSGVAFIERTGSLIHSAAADLPELAENTFYEGWLVKQQPELELISTGDMILQADGVYTVDFASELLYNGYNFVVITLETTKDGTPEKHILEGMAK